MRAARTVLFALLLAPSIASCGASSSSTTATATTTTTTTTTATIPGPPRPWPELTRDERAAHMSREVLPRMSELFAAYDPARYDDFRCTTCHGDDARERAYAMPNPALLPLHPTGSEGQHRTVREHPEGVRFMFSRVMPAMQALLGAPDYDEQTGEGFSCFACHPRAE